MLFPEGKHHHGNGSLSATTFFLSCVNSTADAGSTLIQPYIHSSWLERLLRLCTLDQHWPADIGALLYKSRDEGGRGGIVSRQSNNNNNISFYSALRFSGSIVIPSSSIWGRRHCGMVLMDRNQKRRKACAVPEKRRRKKKKEMGWDCAACADDFNGETWRLFGSYIQQDSSACASPSLFWAQSTPSAF